MFKKSIIIISIVVVLALSVGGIYAYKKNLLTPLFKGGLGGILDNSSDVILTPETLLSFQIKTPNLEPEVIKYYEDKFNEVKASLQESPDDYSNWLYLGILKKGAGDYEGARDCYLYVIQIKPEISNSYANLADLYANFLNEPQKGLAMMQKALELDPNDVNFYLALAEIYRYRLPGQEAMYETVMLDAIQGFPDNPNLIAPLALYYKQTNQIQKAIAQYEALVQLSPANQMAKEDLAELKAGK